MRTLTLSSKAHEKVAKDLERCEAQLEKKNAAVAKGGSNVEQAKEQQAKAANAVKEAASAEETSRAEYVRVRELASTNGLKNLSQSYQRWMAKGLVLFSTAHGVATGLHHTGGGPADTEGVRATVCTNQVKVAQKLMLEEDKRLRMRYPGTFLYKKAEKRGMEKKRFFQLEPPGAGGEGEGGEAPSSSSDQCQFVYYTGVPPAERKGGIAIRSTTEIMTRGKEILIKNTDRKWILSAKTAEEASWYVLCGGNLYPPRTGI